MIKTFLDKDAEALFYGERVRRFPTEICSRAMMKLHRIHAAKSLSILKEFRGDRLELLSPKSRGEWSIRINDQWRIVFKFINGDAYDVRIIDYH